MKKEKENVEVGVLWKCPECEGWNLHALDAGDFVCVGCGYRLYALGCQEIVERPLIK